MIRESEVKPGLLAGRIKSWLTDRDELTAMGKKAGTLGRRQAAEEIVERATNWLKKKGVKEVFELTIGVRERWSNGMMECWIKAFIDHHSSS